jgi:spore germination protein YaaH
MSQKIFHKHLPESEATHQTHKVTLSLTKLLRNLFLIFLVLSGVAFGLWYWQPQPLITPLSQVPQFRFLLGNEAPPNVTHKVIYGYLPYWNTNKVTIQPELTNLSYFGLTMAGDGSIVTQTDEGGEPGYARLKSDTWLELSQQQAAQGGKVEIVLAQFDNDTIVQLLSTPASHEKLLSSLDAILLAYPVQGINIDIEYTGEITPQLRSRLTELMTKIRTHLNQKYDGVNLSIAMYASAASTQQLWEVDKLAEQVDYIVVMAYDFHRRSSPLAGPVAPLFGGAELWDSDISQHLQAFIKKVPPQKILLGVPFYGYEWQTTSRAAQAHAFPDTGSTASFERVQTLLAKRDELKVQEHWNEQALSPYISYIENGEIYVVYYENSRSISYKLDYVNQLDLAGIAIWALGYEGQNRELWDVISRKLNYDAETSI